MLAMLEYSGTVVLEYLIYYSDIMPWVLLVMSYACIEDFGIWVIIGLGNEIFICLG